MKLLTALLVAIGISSVNPVQAKERTLLLMRDGAFYDVEIKKISRYQVVFFNNGRKAQGKIKVPTSMVYAILAKDGNNVFFDEGGRQRIVPAGANDLEGDILFTRDFNFFPVYDLRINDEGLFYKVRNDQHAQYYKMERDNVFMVKHADKHVTLFSSKYVPAANAVVWPTEQPYVHAPRTDHSDREFQAATWMEARQLYDSVCQANPYILYKPGIMLEYGYQKAGYLSKVHGVSYIRQQVADLRANKGYIVPYLMQMVYDDDHDRVKGVPKDYYEYMFPVEIDAWGNYRLHHNIGQDLMQIDSRSGYGVLIPGDMKAGQRLTCSTQTTAGRTFGGKKVTIQSTFKEWHVVGEREITTTAGIFSCMKLRGLIYESINGKKPRAYKIACYMTKGLGIVCYDSMPLDGKEKEPLTLCLMRMQDNTKKKN